MNRLAMNCSVAVLALLCIGGLTITANGQSFCFDPVVNYPAGANASGVTTGDLDADGDIDVIVPDLDNSRVTVLMNAGGGVFSAPVNYAVGFRPNFAYPADLNGDGRLDLAVANAGSYYVSVLLNNGNGTFAPQVIYTADDSPLQVVAADLNGDGYPDLASANWPGGFVTGNVSVMFNNQNGTFTAPVNYLAGDIPASISAADLDGDGDYDLAVTDFLNNQVSIMRNNGSGAFAAAVKYSVGVNPGSVYAADLDGDGDQDLAFSNGSTPAISVLMNNGNAVFGTESQYPISTRAFEVRAADIDGDGDYDLTGAIAESNAIGILANNGDGTFAAAVNYTMNEYPGSVAAADLDGNTTFDLISSNGLYANISVLLNCRTPCVEAPADMVLWLPLDEGTEDPSVNLAAPFHGAQHGSLTNALGKVAGALHFNGAYSYVEVAPYPEIFTSPDPGTGDFTIEAWVQRASGDNGVRVIAEKRSNPAPDTYVGFSFYMYDGRLGLQLANGAYSGWNTQPGEIVPPAGWHHVAVTVDRDNPSGGKFYLDGQQLGSPFNPTVRSGSLSSNAPFCVGSMSFSSSSTFYGDIDEVKMCNRAVGYLEIQAIYAAQDYGNCKTMCLCRFHSDFDLDGFMTALDLSEMIDILFAGHPDVQAPYCPCPRADFDCDYFSTAIDLGKLIDHLFAGGDPPCDPCAQ